MSIYIVWKRGGIMARMEVHVLYVVARIMEGEGGGGRGVKKDVGLRNDETSCKIDFFVFIKHLSI